MTSFKMLLFLFFLYLIKYSQRKVNMSHYDDIYFSFLLYFSSYLYQNLSIFQYNAFDSEQQGFKLCRSSYMPIFFNKYYSTT